MQTNIFTLSGVLPKQLQYEMNKEALFERQVYFSMSDYIPKIQPLMLKYVLKHNNAVLSF